MKIADWPGADRPRCRDDPRAGLAGGDRLVLHLDAVLAENRLGDWPLCPGPGDGLAGLIGTNRPASRRSTDSANDRLVSVEPLTASTCSRRVA
jgi:hypothetical protein